ncbi:hypothetical protein WME75_00360 [Sorangium sp. So ce1014]|uniref:DUF6959 family protein n=1 Tax=Sorangium sp. So ce1014 TaxID=3133326 RepID=UPI003F646715
MKRVELDVVTEMTNAAIMRMHGRKFPGIVLQGDSLNYLRVLAADVKKRLAGINDEELIDSVRELESLLQGYTRAYETALEGEGIDLPYPKGATADGE